MTTVRIRGDGVAASCCGRLLEKGGLLPVFEAADRPKVPALMVGDATQHLLRDVFEREDLFEGLPRIQRRVVAWGPESAPVELPHSAIVVSEQVLLDRIRGTRQEAPEFLDPQWTIFASRPLPESAAEQHFGSRAGAACRVTLRPECDAHTCWVESLPGGWLFLLPSGEETGWLLAVGDASALLLERSRLVSAQIAEVVSAAGSFPCYPRIAEPLCGTNWLACGAGAVGFDPLCGDGTGYATREAILASAVVRAALSGENVDALAAHYTARLLAGFLKHLELCRQFYETGGSGTWWREESGALHRGLNWCRTKLALAPPFRYRLNGFSLEAVDRP